MLDRGVVVVHDGVPMARLSVRFWYLPESGKRRENPSRDAFTADIRPLIGLAGEPRSAPRPTALDPDPQTLKKPRPIPGRCPLRDSRNLFFANLSLEKAQTLEPSQRHKG